MAVFEGETGLSPQAAREEATRCLFCYDAPCVAACPTGIDVPGFIHAIATDNLDGSARTILAANPLGEPVPASARSRACARAPVCACRWTGRSRSAPFSASRWTPIGTPAGPSSCPGPATGKKVAVVGAGPAGLACAAELRRHGIDVTIFEARAKAGGLAAYGIVPWRHARDMTAHEVAEVERAGVEIRRGTRVGEAGAGDVGGRRRRPDGDGAARGVRRRLPRARPGAEPPPRRARRRPRGRGRCADPARAGRDGRGSPGRRRPQSCSRPARRRRRRRQHGDGRCRGRSPAGRRGGHGLLPSGEAEAPAYPHAVELARSLGVRFHWLVAPVEITGTDGRVTGAVFDTMRLGEPDASGRAAPQVIPGAAALRRARRGRRGHRAGIPRASRRRVRGGGAAAASSSTRRRAGPTTRAFGPEATSSTAAARSSTPSRTARWRLRRSRRRSASRPPPPGSRSAAVPTSGRAPGVSLAVEHGRHSQPQPVLAGQRPAHQHRRDGRPRLRGRLGRRRLEDRWRPDHERELAPGLALGGRPAHDRHLEHRADQRPARSRRTWPRSARSSAASRIAPSSSRSWSSRIPRPGTTSSAGSTTPAPTASSSTTAARTAWPSAAWGRPSARSPSTSR